MSTLLKIALPRFALGAGQEFGVDVRTAGGRELRFLAPAAHHFPNQNERAESAAATGMIQASKSKPFFGGSTSTVGPYCVT